MSRSIIESGKNGAFIQWKEKVRPEGQTKMLHVVATDSCNILQLHESVGNWNCVVPSQHLAQAQGSCNSIAVCHTVSNDIKPSGVSTRRSWSRYTWKSLEPICLFASICAVESQNQGKASICWSNHAKAVGSHKRSFFGRDIGRWPSVQHATGVTRAPVDGWGWHAARAIHRSDSDRRLLEPYVCHSSVQQKQLMLLLKDSLGPKNGMKWYWDVLSMYDLNIESYVI